MFNNLGWPELAFLVVLALFIFGPDRLPKVAADAGRMLRQIRQMAQNASQDIKAELGPEMGDIDLADLNPRRFVRKHLFEDLDGDSSSVAARPGAAPLGPGEQPPYDTDAT